MSVYLPSPSCSISATLVVPLTRRHTARPHGVPSPSWRPSSPTLRPSPQGEGLVVRQPKVGEGSGPSSIACPAPGHMDDRFRIFGQIGSVSATPATGQNQSKPVKNGHPQRERHAPTLKIRGFVTTNLQRKNSVPHGRPKRPSESNRQRYVSTRSNSLNRSSQSGGTDAHT